MKGKVVPTEGPPSAAVSTADVVVPVANRSIPTPEHLEHHDYAKLNTAYENKQDSQVAPQAVEKEFVNETSGIDTSLGKFSDGKAIAAVESPLPGGSNGEDAKSTATSENGKIALSATTTAQQDRPSNAPAAAIVVAEENRDTPAIAPQDTTTVYSNDASTVAAQDPLAVTVQQDTPTVGQPEQESVFAEAAAADTNTSGQNNGGENQAIVSSNSSQQQQQEGRSARQTSSSTITTFDVESTENGHESDDEEVSIDERFKGEAYICTLRHLCAQNTSTMHITSYKTFASHMSWVNTDYCA